MQPYVNSCQRVGLEVNEVNTEYFVMTRTQQDNAPLDVDDLERYSQEGRGVCVPRIVHHA